MIFSSNDSSILLQFENFATMVNESARTLALVITAIKNLRDVKGSSSREILNYLSSVYDIPTQVVRRQVGPPFLILSS